jgi:hypothetical protein
VGTDEYWHQVASLVDAQLAPKMPAIVLLLGIAIVIGVIRRRRWRRQRRSGNCPACAGQGWVAGTPSWVQERCTNCGGDGWV